MSFVTHFVVSSASKHRVFLSMSAANCLTEERCVSDALHACLSCASVVPEFKINESDIRVPSGNLQQTDETRLCVGHLRKAS